MVSEHRGRIGRLRSTFATVARTAVEDIFFDAATVACMAHGLLNPQMLPNLSPRYSIRRNGCIEVLHHPGTRQVDVGAGGDRPQLPRSEHARDRRAREEPQVESFTNYGHVNEERELGPIHRRRWGEIMHVDGPQAEATAIHAGRPNFSATLLAFSAARNDIAHHQLPSTAVDQCRAACKHLHCFDGAARQGASVDVLDIGGRRRLYGIARLCATTRQLRPIHLASFADRKVRCELHVTFRISYDKFIAQRASSGCSLRAEIERSILGRCEKFCSYRACRPMARILRLALGGS